MKKQEVVRAGFNETEWSASLRAARLDLNRTSIGREAIDPLVATSCQFETKEIGRYGFTQIAHEIAIESEPEIDVVVMCLQVVAGSDKAQDLIGKSKHHDSFSPSSSP